MAMPWSTPNSAKKIGACSRIGRHEASGFVPVSLYSFIISCDWRSLSPLYFFWISFICGWISCRLRCDLICLTKRGIRAMRMTMTRPTIEKVQVQPLAGFMKVLSSWWNWTRIQLTPSRSQSRMNMISLASVV
ncbi:unannotated protein [freshwater metagenome]|uniref:Unannotated protein n=1 Tax=freshwater metagenome TaxID=449393 RepID=A0A6J7EHE3_9ZZZZ